MQRHALATANDPVDASATEGSGDSDEEKENTGGEDNPTPIKANDPPSYPGIDFSKATINENLRDIPDLYESTGDGKWKTRSAVFQMPLDIEEPASLWLKYPTDRERFYIQYRSNRKKPESERTYGPFDGDPFEVLKLESLMKSRMATDRHHPDDGYRIVLMVRTENKALTERAIRLMDAALSSNQPAYERRMYESRFREATSDKYKHVYAKHGLEKEAQRLSKKSTASGKKSNG